MERQPDGLERLVLEVLGLTLVSGVIVVIAAFHVFGQASEEAQQALVFSLSALAIHACPLAAFVIWRLHGLQRDNQTLFLRATLDGPTQVLNGASFRSKVETELAASRRRGERTAPYTLLVVDVDHFKRINGRLGRSAGDAALVAIARMLKLSVRKVDILGRIGGQEFAILLKGAGLEEARIVAERLRASVEELTVGPKGRASPLTVSMGGISFAGGAPYDAIYRAADANLHRAKTNGRNRVDITSAVRPARVGENQRGATGALAGVAG